MGKRGACDTPKADPDRIRISLNVLCGIVTLALIPIILGVLIPVPVYALSSASDGTNETTTNLTSIGGINNLQNISEHPWLGVSGVNLTQEVAKAYGLKTTQGFLVSEVEPGSPAEKAGIHGGNQSIYINGTYVKLGDIILKIGTKNLSNFQDLLKVISTKNIGDPMDMTVLHNGNIKQVNLTLATKPDFFEYKDTIDGLEMKYPSDWLKDEQGRQYIDDNAVFYPPDNDNTRNNTTNSTTLELRVSDFSQNIKLEDLVYSWFNTIDDAAYCKLIESDSNVTLSGIAAYLQKKTCKDYSDTNIVSVTGNKAYQIVYRLENNKSGLYLPLIDKMIDSLKINSTKVDSDSKKNYTQQFQTYTNPIYGVNLQYPMNWKISKASPLNEGLFGSEIFYSPFVNLSQTTPNQVILSIENFSHDISLDQFTMKHMDDSELVEGFVLIKSKPTKFGDSYRAHSIVFNSTDTDTGDPLKSMDVWTVKGDKAYVLTYTAEPEKYDRFLPVVQKILASFKISN